MYTTPRYCQRDPLLRARHDVGHPVLERRFPEKEEPVMIVATGR